MERIPTETPIPRELARRAIQRIRWPDGPVCPYCGQRERYVPVEDDGEIRIRYECDTCRGHAGTFRHPSPTGLSRPGVLPRFTG